MENPPFESMFLLLKHGGFPASYVSLPEVRYIYIHGILSPDATGNHFQDLSSCGKWVKVGIPVISMLTTPASWAKVSQGAL